MYKHFMTIATLGVGFTALATTNTCTGVAAASATSRVSTNTECRSEPQKVKASKKLTKKNFTVSDFQELDVSGEGTVVFEQADGASSLAIEAPENLFDYLSVKSGDGTLSIARDHDVTFEGTRKITYHVKSKSLEQAVLTGAIGFEADRVEGDTFSIEAHGDAHVRLRDLRAKLFKAKLAGSASASVAGSVEKQEVKLSGAVSYDASGLASNDCKIKASGASQATVRAVKSLVGSVSGSGALRYGGNPLRVDLERSASATIRKIK